MTARKDYEERNKKRMFSLEAMHKTNDAVKAFRRKPYQGCGVYKENSSILHIDQTKVRNYSE